MGLTDVLVLPPDVRLIPVTELPVHVRGRLDGEGDVAVTHQSSRLPSTLVDAELAELLGEFTAPSTVADAVLRFSRKRARDAERVLEEAHGPLRLCLSRGYLVPSGSPLAQGHRPAFHAGQRVAGRTVLRCVHALADTELYAVAAPDATLAALKVLRADAPEEAVEAFAHEMAVLRILSGRVGPRLLDAGSSGEDRWFAMEWVEGVEVGSAAATLRAGPARDDRVLDLCLRVTAAYATLHRLGVAHGDVHPGNILVGPDGTVRLVDFGLARLLDRPTSEAARRGGAPGFLAPDHAAALLERRMPPPASPASDLYSLAVVLYQLLTGASYLDLDLDEQVSLREVVESPPLPFTRRGCPAWPAVEDALTRALAKDEAHRLSSVAALTDLLEAARVRRRSRDPGPARSGVAALLDAVLARADVGGDWFEEGLPTAPLCSVAYGAAGLALTMHHVAALRDDAGLAALADEWALRAVDGVRRPGALADPVPDMDPTLIGAVSPFHRESGVHAARALVSHALGDVPAEQHAIAAFVRASGEPCDGFDLTLGRTGTLLACALLVEGCADDRAVSLADVRALGDATLRDLWRWLESQPPIPDGRGLTTLGVAHGWAGVLLASLRWSEAVGAVPPQELPGRLDQLAAIGRHDGPATWWPWDSTVAGAMTGWCNGSAGLVHLWTAAHARYGEDRWLRLAEGAGWHASSLTAVPQICCGLAGQAYGELELYRHTGDRHWLTLARQLADAAAERDLADRMLCVSGSLHKGEVGIAALAADLERPEEASMPFFGSSL